MDSELIPLESGELCVAAIVTALSDNSKQIVAAQKNDKDISTVRNWISSDTFPECVQDFAPASYELKLRLAVRVYTSTQRMCCGALAQLQGHAHNL